MLLLFARVRCLLVCYRAKKITTMGLANFRRFKYENSGKTACSEFFFFLLKTKNVKTR